MKLTIMLCGVALLAACGPKPAEKVANTSEPEQVTTDNVTVKADFPASLAAFGDGYPKAGDPCRRLGESAATSNYLDDSADLVGCPTADQAKALGGKVVATVDGFTLVSVPSRPMPAPARAASADPIRGKGGLEEKCLAAVAKATGARVIGTNRIDQSQAATDIYVNVEGAEKPWRCRGTRDGKLEGVEYTAEG
ncbi:hypothetical protein ABDK56_09185 [Sphingomonas sp. ASV193]|uniref:hypothetical protein n=1 Tax=Sphingomonas sp. ASV193 TaxID=3144405 RepID=UPI0032E8C4A2